MESQGSSPYERLGVSPAAGAAEITSAYRRLLRRHHPDSAPSRAGEGSEPAAGGRSAGETLRDVIEAYELLRDPRRRADYDRGHPVVEPPEPARAPSSPSPAPPPSARFTARGDDHLLLRASPVSWQQVPPAGIPDRRHGAAPNDDLAELIQTLHAMVAGRRPYW